MHVPACDIRDDLTRCALCKFSFSYRLMFWRFYRVDSYALMRFRTSLNFKETSLQSKVTSEMR